MFKKTAILIFMFFLFLGLENCKSPEEPEAIYGYRSYKYRSNVEIIYKRGTGDYKQVQDKVRLHYYLYDPAITEGPYYFRDLGTIDMNKIGKNKYRCYLHKVFIQTLDKPDEHRVSVDDWIIDGGMKGESVDIQGAFEQEITRREVVSNAVRIWIDFKMSRE